MNVLEEVLATRSDEEIVSMYNGFIQTWNNSSAAQLRAAYILHHYFQDSEMSKTLIYFIEEEYDFIHSSKISHKKKDGSREVFYTAINPFLKLKLNKASRRFTKKQLFQHAEEGLERENYLFYNDEYFYRMFRTFLISVLSRGTQFAEDNDSYLELIYCIKDVNRSLIPIVGVFNGDGELEPLYQLAINQYEEFIVNEAPTRNEFRMENYEKKRVSIRNGLLILMAMYIMDSKYLELNLLLSKAITITPKEEPLYWTLRFLEKEYQDKVQL